MVDSCSKNALSLAKRLLTSQCRDSIISVGTGRPRAINLEDSDVVPLKLADFDQPAAANIFIAYVSICRLMGDIAQAQRRNRAPENAESELRCWMQDLPPVLHLYQNGKLASYDFKARQLFVPYLVSIILLQRPFSSEQTPVSSASLIASSLVSGIFEDFLSRDQLRYLGPASTFYALAAGLMQLIGWRYETLRQSSEECYQIIRKSLQELGQRYGSAHGALRALTKAKDHVAGQSSIMELPPSPTSDFSTLFTCFGEELCSQWSLLASSTNSSKEVRPANEIIGSQDAVSRPAIELFDVVQPAGAALDSEQFAPFPYTNLDDAWLVLDSTTAPVGSWLFDDYDISLT